MLLFFFIQIRNSEICILFCQHVYCTYECVHVSALCVVAFRRKTSIHFIFSFILFAITPLALLIKTFKPFYPLNDILNN